MLRESPEPAGAPAGSRPSSFLTLSEAVLLLVLAAVQFTHIVDFMIVMPLGPVYSREMRLTPQQFSHVVAAYTLSAGIASLVASRYLDRFGRKSALVVLYAGFVVGTAVCAIASSYWALLAARTVTGAFGGVAASVVLASVGDAFPMERRGMAMGVIMSAFSVASIAGVPLGLWIAEAFGWQAPFAVLAGLGCIVLVLAYFVLPPMRGHIGHEPAREVSTLALIANPNHIRAYLLMVSLVFVSFTVAPYLPTYLTANVGLRQEQLKWMYLAGGLATLVTLTYFGRLADRFGKLLVFRWLAVATIASVIFITNLPAGLSLALVLTATTFMFIATSGRMVPAMALLTATAAPAERGGFMSVNAAVQHVGAGAATWLGGLVLHQANESSPLEGYAWIGIVSGLASVASLYLAGRLRPAPGGELAPDSPEIVAAETGAEVAAS
jgi:MFS transporter, DHA1 family, inner membrane transport protein